MLNIVGLKEAGATKVSRAPQRSGEMRGKKFLGPYTLIEKIGAGATGTVYKGYDEQLDRGVPDSLIAAFRKMTAKSPRDRYADYLDLLNDLDKIETEISA